VIVQDLMVQGAREAGDLIVVDMLPQLLLVEQMHVDRELLQWLEVSIAFGAVLPNLLNKDFGGWHNIANCGLIHACSGMPFYNCMLPPIRGLINLLQCTCVICIIIRMALGSISAREPRWCLGTPLFEEPSGKRDSTCKISPP
jgi:hypothetical protein